MQLENLALYGTNSYHGEPWTRKEKVFPESSSIKSSFAFVSGVGCTDVWHRKQLLNL
jgi:hypothetical protein